MANTMDAQMADKTPDVPANRDLAQAPKRAAKRPQTFDEAVEALNRFIHFEPLIREIDYQVLLMCEQRRGLAELEEAMAALPEFAGATRDQFALITELVDHGGLDFFELDADGAVVTEAAKEGLTENEVDDLVVGFAYQTTAVGRAVAQALDPALRFSQLVAAAPERRSLYLALLEFLREKHSFAAVDSYMGSAEGSALIREAQVAGIQPSVFVDKLERAGVLRYDKGWQATAAGLAVLEAAAVGGDAGAGAEAGAGAGNAAE